MRLLWKLLRCHLSVAQTLGFALAGLVGMAIVLTALQAYGDLLPLFDRPETILRGDYLVLSKKVGALQSVGLASGDFTVDELDELKAQPFVREVGAFVPADYRVKGSVGLGGMELSTYLFFESVPDRFLDVETDGWDYAPGNREIPIIIPRNYLNLYNHGFAKSQGLPQISEGIFRRFSLDIGITGNGRTEQFKGRIVGFSNRLNTILVPEAFISWSNVRFGSGDGQKQPARVIVETDGPVDASAREYLASKGYETEGAPPQSDKAALLLRLAASVAGAVGLLFSAMSFYVLLLSIFLLLQKNSDKLRSLLLLGYTPARVARPYQLLTLGLNAAVLLLALTAVWLARQGYLPALALLQEGYRPAGMAPTVLCGIALALLLTTWNGAAIRRKIGRLTPGRR